MPKHSSFARIASFSSVQRARKDGLTCALFSKNSPKSYPAPAFAARCGSAFDLSPAPGVPRSRARRVDAEALFVCSNRFVFKRTAGSESRVDMCTFFEKLTEILPGASFRGAVRLRLRSEPGARGTTFESTKSRCRSTLRLLESLRFQAYSGLGKSG